MATYQVVPLTKLKLGSIIDFLRARAPTGEYLMKWQLSTLIWAEQFAKAGRRRAIGAFFVAANSNVVIESSFGTNDEPLDLGDQGGSPIAERISRRIIEQISVSRISKTLSAFQEFQYAIRRDAVDVHLLTGYVPESLPSLEGKRPAALWITFRISPRGARIVILDAIRTTILHSVMLPPADKQRIASMLAMGTFKKLMLVALILSLILAIALGSTSSFWLILAAVRCAAMIISLFLEAPNIPAARSARLRAIQKKLQIAKKKMEQAEKKGAANPNPADIQDVKDAIKELGDEIDKMKEAGEIDEDTAKEMKDKLEKANKAAEKAGKK